MMIQAANDKHAGPNIIAEVFRLLRPFWYVAILSTLMGVCGGLSSAGNIIVINRALSDGFSFYSAMYFVLLSIFAVLGEAVAQLGNSYVGQNVIAKLRKEISKKIVMAPIAAIERIHAHRILASLAADTEAVTALTFNISGIIVNISVAFGCMTYLFFMSTKLALIMLVCVGGGISVNFVARRRWISSLEEARRLHDELQKHYRTISDGAKELRINRPRRISVFKRQLSEAIDRICRYRLKAMHQFSLASAISGCLFFLALGLILWTRGSEANGGGIIAGFVLVLLYLRGPITQLVNTLPLIGQAQVALRHISELSSSLADPEPNVLLTDHPSTVKSFEAIELRNVTYTHAGLEPDRPFIVGPIELKISRAETIFIVGENGCGKTTLIKLILGLYQPGQGNIILDGRCVTSAIRDDYRQLFSAIFFDYYLFDDILVSDAEVTENIENFYEKLDLTQKASLLDGRFSVTELSAGQRKRVALVQLYVENRPIAIFDEWAAEQDPTFRRIFYTELLYEFKKRGITLIVVSHDDRYFHVADRIIKMKDGCIDEIIDGSMLHRNESTAEKRDRAPGVNNEFERPWR